MPAPHVVLPDIASSPSTASPRPAAAATSLRSHTSGDNATIRCKPPALPITCQSGSRRPMAWRKASRRCLYRRLSPRRCRS